MDVTRASQGLAFLALSLFLTACNSRPSAAEEVVEKPLGDCSATAIPNRFVVNWKNGETTTVEANDRDELIKNVIEPHLDKIAFAEHDYLVSRNEPGEIRQQSYYLSGNDNWGQLRVRADRAWASGITGQGVIVAVIDSGVDITHPKISGRLAINEGESGAIDSVFCRKPENANQAQCDRSTNELDDDGNGFIDDVSGWDFYSKSNAVSDGTGHGTHVAGVILAEHSASGVKGVAPGATLIPLDFMNDFGDGRVGDAILAIKYAADRGAKIINASWGGAPCSKSLMKAISDVGARGVLFVAASGNGDQNGRGINLDLSPSYPAAYGLPNQITVGASASTDYMAGFSNYGTNTVQILAPGVNILSSYPGNQSAYMDGTSMATPFVSGAAALLWSASPQASLSEIRTALLNSAEPRDYPVSTRGRLNIESALSALAAGLR